ncbi:MAG: hypothetical protein R3322_00330 [Kiloniellales bacterium]|nr:hypothetical protein [Kiloniellales bacterium]
MVQLPIGKLLSIVFGVLVTVGGAIWALSGAITGRPTQASIDEQLKHHNEAGHRDLAERVSEIRAELTAQRALQERLTEEQAEQDVKLDAILEAVK